MNILDKIKEIIIKMNNYGIPIPIMRVGDKPSITATMVILSFTTALVGQLGKVSGFFGTIDLSQANYLFGICLAGYLGRKFQGDGKKIDISEEKQNG